MVNIIYEALTGRIISSPLPDHRVENALESLYANGYTPSDIAIHTMTDTDYLSIWKEGGC